MPARSLVLFAAALTGLLGCASQPETSAASASARASTARVQKTGPFEVTSAQFGIFGADSDGRRILFETDRFPAVIAAPYGWYIIFKTNKPTVVWREEFELPEPPPSWGPGEALGIYTISPDRKT